MIEKKKAIPIYKYYLYSILIMATILTFLRIYFYFFQDPFFSYNRDIDFNTLYVFMESGLVNYYNTDSIGGFRAYYLYYWYFLFYPIYLFPVHVGVYIWDALRVIASIFVAKRIDSITENNVDKVIFFVLSGLGFFADAYLNNNNWLIQAFLVLSFDLLNEDKKWHAGLLFTLAMYKIIVIIFPFMLLIVKKIKLKDLIYYFLPLSIFFLPYLIFPDYFLAMYYNWTYMEIKVEEMNFLLLIYLYCWQVFQTAQLMFEGFIILIFLENIKTFKWRKRYRILILTSLIALNTTFPFILWPLLYG
ncbi:MAG: glycosyltransferase 87 family protein [Promethearchaeota archaeon]